LRHGQACRLTFPKLRSATSLSRPLCEFSMEKWKRESAAVVYDLLEEGVGDLLLPRSSARWRAVRRRQGSGGGGAGSGALLVSGTDAVPASALAAGGRYARVGGEARECRGVSTTFCSAAGSIGIDPVTRRARIGRCLRGAGGPRRRHFRGRLRRVGLRIFGWEVGERRARSNLVPR
jgi:hypothetical protein